VGSIPRASLRGAFASFVSARHAALALTSDPSLTSGRDTAPAPELGLPSGAHQRVPRGHGGTPAPTGATVTTLQVPDLARRRGRIPASWLFAPIWLFWTGSLLWTLFLTTRRTPDEAPFVAALYVCVGFFLHGYTVAWRTASVWRFPAWLVSLGLLAVLGLWHIDASAARVVYPLDIVQTRAPEPRLVASAICHSMIAVMVTVHVFFLGFGSRAASPKEMAQHLTRRGLVRGTPLTRPLVPLRLPGVTSSDATDIEDSP
jgi:hypothetical protein